jgi:3-deoxy-D-manno-octulosonic-acid transferase
MTNFKEIAKNVLDLSAAIQCVDKEEIKNAVFLLNEDEKHRVDMATKAKQFITTNQGTTERIARLISAKLSQVEI